MQQETMFELADRLKALRDQKDALEAELKQVNMDIDNADWHLANHMAETESFCRNDVLGVPRRRLRHLAGDIRA